MPPEEISLHEEVLMIPVKPHHVRKPLTKSTSSGNDASAQAGPIQIERTDKDAPAELETTIFKPPGRGPFPLLILNHGKAAGDTHAQERARFLAISREFVKRGYAVVIPMRSGFSRSTGEYVEQHCKMEANGQIQANDVQGALEYVLQQPWADKKHILLAGQSYGGLAALALATRDFPGVKGVINFAGGLRTIGGCQWQTALTKAFAEYGARTAIPSLWFYGENDSHFNTELAARLHQAYTAGGGRATLITFGPFKNDAHAMSGSRDGVRIWWPETEKFLRRIGMPSEELFSLAEEIVPPKTGYAVLDDVDALPYLKGQGREQYRIFLGKTMPRAFALSPSGAWSWTEDGDDPAARALENCQKNSALPCKLYAVDDYVVWNGKG